MRTLYATLIVLFSIFFLTATNAYAENAKEAKEKKFSIALSGNASTLGLGGQIIAGVVPSVNAKVGANVFQYDYQGSSDDLDFDAELKLLNFSVLADWFPFKNNFRLTGGIVINQNEIDITVKRDSTYDIGDATYNSTEVGSLTGIATFNDVAPYAGIGFGNPLAKGSSWSFLFDMGVMFQGSPGIDLSVTGTMKDDETFKTELAREENNLEDKLGPFQYYPVISIGVAYRF